MEAVLAGSGCHREYCGHGADDFDDEEATSP
jgi:hypothetical protein